MGGWRAPTNYPPDDPAALARAAARVLSRDDTRRRLGRGAEALAAAFDWDEISRQTAALYRQLVT